jgi:hypothetical protein
MAASGDGSELPITLIDLFHRTLKTQADKPALSQKINKKWETYTYKQYYQKS